jgi:hypothetical protein
MVTTLRTSLKNSIRKLIALPTYNVKSYLQDKAKIHEKNMLLGCTSCTKVVVEVMGFVKLQIDASFGMRIL